MTIQKLKKIFGEFLSDHFIIYDNKDSDFSFLKKDTILLAGKDETELFHITIIKIK